MVMIPNPPRMGDMPKGEPVPEAVYHARIDKADYKLSQEKQNPMAELMLTIFGPAEAEEYIGRKLFDNLMLTGEGMFKTRQLLEASGEDDDFLLEDTEQLLGREVGVVVQMEKERPDPRNPGKNFPQRNKIARYIPISETESEEALT